MLLTGREEWVARSAFQSGALYIDEKPSGAEDRKDTEDSPKMETQCRAGDKHGLTMKTSTARVRTISLGYIILAPAGDCPENVRVGKGGNEPRCMRDEEGGEPEKVLPELMREGEGEGEEGVKER